ncbi:MAG: MgtC/SapB family protein [Butyrivibrio sp.]|nr:MgtC/SapB family protein [Butyrivibrio sp.]
MTFATIIDYLQSTDSIAVAIRLVIATVFGGLVGWERIIKHHSAGIKTHALVSLGSASATALNIYLAMIPGLNADASRIPAGVVSGIGFIGAGTIIVTGRKQIKGLSTAATVWVTSCMGMAIGAGYLEIGCVCLIMVEFSNILLKQLSNKVEGYSKFMNIYIEVNKNRGVNKLRNLLSDNGFSIISMTKSKEKTLQSSDTGLILDLDLGRNKSHDEVLNVLSNEEFVNYVEEV